MNASDYKTNLDRLRMRLRDTQTKSCLLRYGATPSLAHLFSADIYYNADATNPLPEQWTSQFTIRTHNTTIDFATHLAASATLPPLAQHLLCFPASQGGIGHRHYPTAAISSFLTPLIRSLQLVNRPATEPRPPQFHRHLYDSWQTSNNKLFCLFRRACSALLPHFPKKSKTIPNMPANIQRAAILLP